MLLNGKNNSVFRADVLMRSFLGNKKQIFIHDLYAMVACIYYIVHCGKWVKFWEWMNPFQTSCCSQVPELLRNRPEYIWILPNVQFFTYWHPIKRLSNNFNFLSLLLSFIESSLSAPNQRIMDFPCCFLVFQTVLIHLQIESRHVSLKGFRTQTCTWTPSFLWFNFYSLALCGAVLSTRQDISC